MLGRHESITSCPTGNVCAGQAQAGAPFSPVQVSRTFRTACIPVCCITEGGWSMQAVEKQMETGGELDKYEIEGPDRAELLQDLGEFQLASVSA